jgi:PKD repeat protein
LNADGSFAYIPNAGFSGPDSFTYVANDGTVDSNVATVSITVQEGDNQPPVANDDAYTTDEDVALNVAAPGVLANDTDADGNPLTAILQTGPSNGTLTLNGDGSLSYMPDLNYFGPDSFTYVASDGIVNSNNATVSITVTAVNDAPIADANGPYSAFVGVAITFDGSGSSDVDGFIAGYMWDFGDGSTDAGVAPMHAYAAPGVYTVTLTVTDDGGLTGSATSTATITVESENLPPVSDPNGPYTGQVGEKIRFDGTASYDPDGTIVHYGWIFGDGNFDDGDRPKHAYKAPGTYTVTLTVTDNEGAQDTATTTVVVEAAEPNIDLDIKSFRVSKRFNLDRPRPIEIHLTVENNGNVPAELMATVVGVQNGIEVYYQEMDVSDALGNGGTMYTFQEYSPTTAGNIMWTATLEANDADVDIAEAITVVTGGSSSMTFIPS